MISLEMASNPVVTLCGWLESRLPASNSCPVCKAGLEKSKLIPIYARGRTQDPRDTAAPIPERPAGQRPPTPPQVNRFNQRFGFGGFFPFGMDFTTPGGAQQAGVFIIMLMAEEQLGRQTLLPNKRLFRVCL
ncbi:hypothetical protein BC829DRAFT_415559 [Chytridium lagenaria]|nr:hypothetical protein BC829DRAFT_415559 [Chytridium lagenaria]